MSLIELLAASTIGIILLVSIGSSFIAGQRAARKTANELMLSQGMAQLLYYMRDDARRAGYNLSSDSPKKLDGSDKVYVIDADTSGNPILAYTYRLSAGKSELVAYKWDMDKLQLRLCIEQNKTKLTDCTKGNYQSMLDPAQLQVTSFELAEMPLGTPAISSQVTVTLTLQLTADPAKSLSKSISFVQRS